MNWEEFLAPYKQAVNELKVKLKGIRDQFEKSDEHTPVEFVTGRVKPIPSILDKAKRKDIPTDKLREEMHDIAGLRVMCQFVEDINRVIQHLRNRRDFDIVEERDYVTNQKESGYRSYHVVVRYPVQTISGEQMLLVEIQIRTLAMNFWATIEHSLNYKYNKKIPNNIQRRLQRAAEAASRLDDEMSEIRVEIKEAQKVFMQKKENEKKNAEN
ncbi:GTP pyrophosphokinase [Guptibacillus algicola]|uniref:GTP pyrophosphokinase n=1 Tax=Guptibacillus algicola TaxID=225844 RepID=UPI001CD1C14B|nr:GTP pyrophosphokinase family protein [Alkalihalobacillus algicola]MCA0987831.1 GTP pyrophosphokinase family protein [Alkalihalobacillus algicola]